MKLQINTDVKTITIDEAVEAGELFELLNTMFPNFTWKSYMIIPEKVILHWKDPITIPWTPRPWFDPIIPYTPTTPVTYPWVTCGTTSDSIPNTMTMNAGDNKTFTSSTYNVIINKK